MTSGSSEFRWRFWNYECGDPAMNGLPKRVAPSPV
jgi:hypothetical protein